MLPACPGGALLGPRAMLLAPFRARAAHIVQLRSVGIEGLSRQRAEAGEELPPDVSSHVADEQQLVGIHRPGLHDMMHLRPPLARISESES